VVCGGFAVPIRDGLAQRAYVVASSDFMAIFAANNLFKALAKYAPSGGARLGGIIANSLMASYAKSLIADFAEHTGTRVVGHVPRSLMVSQSELYGKTVIEAAPSSEQAQIYRSLAKDIVENVDVAIPRPLNAQDLKVWARAWGDRVLNTELGVVEQAAGI
jgi:nitrogenase iron protein NifH